MPQTGARCKPRRLAQRRRPTVRHHSAVPSDEIRPMRSLGLLSVAHAVNHAQAVLLPLIYLAIIDEFGVGVQTIAFLAAFGAFASRRRPAELRGADPGRVPASPARHRRHPVRWRVRAPGVRHELPHLRRPERRVADRRLAPAPGRQRPARRAVPGRAARVRDQRPHRGRQRRAPSSSRSSACRSSRWSAGAARRSSSGSRRSSSRSRSWCSSGSAARTAPRPGRAARVRAAFGRILARPRPALAVPRPRSWAAAAAGSASSTCSCCST